MKKFKIISILICALTIISALAVTVSAKWWDENPFTDVKSSHWYYDAVRITNENGIFNGTGETVFTPNGKMTRAMLVQALASADGFNKEDYKYNNQFTDVKSNHWFAPAVEWAYETKVTSGKTDTTFAPNENITREQLAAMLCRYAEYKGMTIENKADITEFPDASKVSSYAVENLKWAYGNGIVNGSKSGDKLYLNPRNPATRAECATMFSKYLYLTPTYEINGNDLSLYTIVRSKNAIETVVDAATALSKNIEMSTGYTLPVVTDNTPAGEYEILVGETNREVDIDKTLLTDIKEFMWTVDGNKLVFFGTDSEPGKGTKEEPTYRMNGSQLAVTTFSEKVLGIEFYTKDLTVATPDPVISLEDGYTYVDHVDFKWRTLDIDGNRNNHTENYHAEWGCGLPHQIGNLMFGYWKEGRYDNLWDNPCYTDPDNVASLIQNVRELMESRPHLTLIGLIQNDSHNYCRCATCSAAFREAGSRNGALLKLINTVCETFEDEYPNLKFATWAYTWGIKPPTNLQLHDNIIVYFNTIALDPAHAYNDSSCTYNKDVVSWLEGWSSLADEMYLWDHSGYTMTPHTPCSNFDDLRTNVRLFADYGIDGMFMNAVSNYDGYSDFNGIRSYLYDHLFRDSYMSEEEYSYRLNSILRARYGEGYLSLRAYIDELSALPRGKCSTFFAFTQGIFDYAEVRKQVERFDKYFADAKAKATEEQLERIEFEELSWTYLKQCALHETEYVNGTEAQRAEYVANNQKLYETFIRFGQEPYDHTWNYDPTVNPHNW